MGEEHLAAQVRRGRASGCGSRARGTRPGRRTRATRSLRARQHVRRVVGHQVAHAAQVVAAAAPRRRPRRCRATPCACCAVADAELEHVDLVGQLGPLVEAVQRVHEGVDLVAPELGVRAVGDAAGEGRGVVLLEGLVPGAEMAPVAAVERPHHALARAHPVLEVDALVDVGDEPERLGQAVDDLGRRSVGAVDVLRAAHVDGDLGQRAVVDRWRAAARTGTGAPSRARGSSCGTAPSRARRRGASGRGRQRVAASRQAPAGCAARSSGSARPMSLSWMTNSLPSLPQGGAWRRGMVDLGGANRDRRMAGIA